VSSANRGSIVNLSPFVMDDDEMSPCSPRTSMQSASPFFETVERRARQEEKRSSGISSLVRSLIQQQVPEDGEERSSPVAARTPAARQQRARLLEASAGLGTSAENVSSTGVKTPSVDGSVTPPPDILDAAGVSMQGVSAERELVERSEADPGAVTTGEVPRSSAPHGPSTGSGATSNVVY